MPRGAIDYMPCSHKAARCVPAASIHRIATHEHIQVCTCSYNVLATRLLRTVCTYIYIYTYIVNAIYIYTDMYAGTAN